MYVIDVIPIGRGIGSQTLSYFSKTALPAGTIVRVELRTRLISALVTESRPATEEKTRIRSSSFSLKKIVSVSNTKIISDAALAAAHETAQALATTTGAVLSSLIPKALLESKAGSTIPVPPATSNQSGAVTFSEILAIQTDDADRMAHYRRVIREQFAKNASVIIAVPTAHTASVIKNALTKGIEEYAVVLHGSLPKPEMLRLWTNAVAMTHPILIITTGLFLTIPRSDITTIIIEREHSSAYRVQSRPFLDIRLFAEYLAKKIGARLIMGDSLLRIETLWRIHEGAIQELAPIKFRSLNKTHQAIVDMRPYSKSGGGAFAVFSEELIECMRRADRDLRKIILFSMRRGLATETVCEDCGTIVRCGHCNAPAILHKQTTLSSAPFFLCHNCGERRSAHERCVNCSSWRLAPLGIGTERVEEEVKKLFPSLPCFRLDADTAGTVAAAAKIVNEFRHAAKGVIVGTEALLHHTLEPADTAAIVSLDALFAIPDFRIHEKIVHVILAIRDLSKETFILQTRNPDEAVLSDACSGHLADFYRREIEMRKTFLYPPFSTIVKITTEGSKTEIAKTFETLAEAILPLSLSLFPAYVRSGRNTYALHGIIKVPSPLPLDQNLYRILTALPPHISVNINPESML